MDLSAWQYIGQATFYVCVYYIIEPDNYIALHKKQEITPTVGKAQFVSDDDGIMA